MHSALLTALKTATVLEIRTPRTDCVATSQSRLQCVTCDGFVGAHHRNQDPVSPQAIIPQGRSTLSLGSIRPDRRWDGMGIPVPSFNVSAQRLYRPGSTRWTYEMSGAVAPSRPPSIARKLVAKLSLASHRHRRCNERPASTRNRLRGVR